MILNVIIKYHKRKLNKMIEKNVDYNLILQESRILDKYIIKIFRKKLS